MTNAGPGAVVDKVAKGHRRRESTKDGKTAQGTLCASGTLFPWASSSAIVISAGKAKQPQEQAREVKLTDATNATK